MFQKLFPQNLLKNLSERLKNLEEYIENNFLNIIKITLIVGGIALFFIVLLVLLITRLSSPTVTVKKEENKIINKYEENINKVELLTINEFVFPDIKLFDLSSDYVDFIPSKKFNISTFKQSVKDYDSILEKSINESLKFGFEK